MSEAATVGLSSTMRLPVYIPSLLLRDVVAKVEWQVIKLTHPPPMSYKIFCILRGGRPAFAVKIKQTETVDDLKDAIKAKCYNM